MQHESYTDSVCSVRLDHRDFTAGSFPLDCVSVAGVVFSSPRYLRLSKLLLVFVLCCSALLEYCKPGLFPDWRQLRRYEG